MMNETSTNEEHSIAALLEIQKRILSSTEKKITIEERRKQIETQKLKLEQQNAETVMSIKNLLEALTNELVFLRQNVHPIISNIQFWMPLNLECNRTLITHLISKSKNSDDINNLNELLTRVSNETLTSINNLTINTNNSIDTIKSNKDVNLKIKGE